MIENLIGATTAVFPIRLSVAVTSPVDVEWATRDGSAVAGSDYKATAGTVTFLPGETEKQIEVQVYGQAITPADDKIFFIRLNPPSNAVLVDAILTCTINIIDDQGTPSVAVVIAEGRRGPKGDPGLSAYEQAVLMGYTGTLAEWMDQIADASKAADRAGDHAVSAAEDALKAQNAAKNAVFAGVVFPTAAEGVDPILGVKNGAYFNVRSPLSEHYIDEYQNVNGVAVATGKSYPTSDYVQYISEHTALPFVPETAYKLNRRVVLANGDIVKSTVDGNANDPNVDMVGWVKVNSAGQIFDESRKSQQDVNDTQKKKQRSVLDYGAVPSLDVASDIAFSNAVADLQDGDTLTVDGEFYLAESWSVNKQINLVVNGDIYLNGDANNSINISSPIDRELVGGDLVVLPKKGDSQLQLTPAVRAELGNLSDYFIVIRSTEKLVNRLGYDEAGAYLKSETNFFTHNDGSLANSIYLDYTDSSKFYARIYRKGRQTNVRNLIPKIKQGTFSGTSRSSLVIIQGRSNIRFENCGFSKKDTVSNGVGWTQIDCVLLEYDSPNAAYWNKTSGDSYAFLSNYCAYVTFNNPKCVHSIETKRDRFYAARHSSKITFNNLVGSFDEHWGYDYVLNNYTSPKDNVITFAGGDLTINNPDNPAGIMIQSRTDTPYCEGTLRITGGSSNDYLIYNYLATDVLGAAFTRKFFDRIVIDGTEILNNGGQGAILMNDYGNLAGITQQKTALTLTGVRYKRKADAAANGCLIIGNSTAKAFSEIVIDNLEPNVDGVDTVATKYPLFKTVRGDSLTVSNTKNFTFQNSVFDQMLFVGGSLGDHNLGFYDLNVSDYAKFTGSTFNASAGQYSVASGLLDKVFYVGCLFKTATHFTTTALANAIAGAYANTFDASIPDTLYTLPINLTNYTNPTRIRNLQSTYTIGSAASVPANGVSAVYPPSSNISLNGARVGDAIGAGITVGGLQVLPYCDVNNTVKFYLKNNTATAIEVPAGTVVKFKVL